jgi:hypothetical protein
VEVAVEFQAGAAAGGAALWEAGAVAAALEGEGEEAQQNALEGEEVIDDGAEPGGLERGGVGGGDAHGARGGMGGGLAERVPGSRGGEREREETYLRYNTSRTFTYPLITEMTLSVSQVSQGKGKRREIAERPGETLT